MPKPRLCFTVVSELFRGKQFVFDGGQPILIGRTADNTLALDHRSVSRRHARVEADGEGYVLVDLGSHNGTRVGDKLISRHAIVPGDVIGLGEIQLAFTLVEEPGGAAGAAPGAGGPDAAAAGASALPAVAPQAPQGAAVGRPLTVEELFAAAGPTQTVPTGRQRRNYWPAIYALLMVAIVVLGLAAFWAVGVPPKRPVRLDVLVRAGEVMPVNLAWLPGPSGKGYVPGIGRVEDIGTPTDQRVADAKRTRFRGFVAVVGKALGTTDIPIYGQPAGMVILRVLVRESRPEPEVEVWRRKPPAQRIARAHELIERARTLLRHHSVNELTWGLMKDLDTAARLLEAIPPETANAAWAAQTARALREALDRRYERLARDIDILRDQGKLKEAIAAARELLSLFPDPQSEEHHVITMFYESLLEEEARAEREAQEKR